MQSTANYVLKQTLNRVKATKKQLENKKNRINVNTMKIKKSQIWFIIIIFFIDLFHLAYIIF